MITLHTVFRVNASSNVFLEPLFGARDLETTPHYITNNKQMIDFFWFRESGMRISIGVEDINILPLYEDVTYESDNNFMLNYPNTEKEKDHFQKIISHHCRCAPVGHIQCVSLWLGSCIHGSMLTAGS